MLLSYFYLCWEVYDGVGLWVGGWLVGWGRGVQVNMWRSEGTSNVNSLLSSYNQTHGMGFFVFFHLPFHCRDSEIIDTHSMCSLACIWLCAFCGSKLQSSCLWSKPFILWVIIPAQDITNFKLFSIFFFFFLYSLVWHLTFSTAKLQFYPMLLLTFTFLSYCAESRHYLDSSSCFSVLAHTLIFPGDIPVHLWQSFFIFTISN